MIITHINQSDVQVAPYLIFILNLDLIKRIHKYLVLFSALSLALFPENTKGKSLEVAPSSNVRIDISDEVLTGLADDSPVIVAANVYTGAEVS